MANKVIRKTFNRTMKKKCISIRTELTTKIDKKYCFSSNNKLPQIEFRKKKYRKEINQSQENRSVCLIRLTND